MTWHLLVACWPVWAALAACAFCGVFRLDQSPNEGTSDD